VQSGWITSLFAPYMRGFYVTPSRIAEKRGKVTLVVASKGVGKTNLTRMFTQAPYIAGSFPIIVFSGGKETSIYGKIKKEGSAFMVKCITS